MRIFVTLLLLFLQARLAFAAEEFCEARLTTSIAIVTARSLRQGRLTLEEVRAMAASSLPFNPALGGKRRVGRMALKDYYSVNLALPETERSWAKIREELASIIAHWGDAQQISKEAAEHTAEVLGPHHRFTAELPLVGSRRSLWYRTSSGKTYLIVRGSDGQTAIYDLFAQKTVAMEKLSEEIWVEELANGELYARAFNSKRGEIQSIDLKTGKLTAAPMTLENARRARSENFDLKNRPLEVLGTPGRYVLAIPASPRVDTQAKSFEYNLTLNSRDADGKWKPLHQEPIRFVKAKYGNDEPHVIALPEGNFAAVAIEPGKDEAEHFARFYPPFASEPTQPVFLHAKGMDELRSASAFQVDGRVFVSLRGRDKRFWYEMQLFEPARSLEPIFTYVEQFDFTATAFIHRGQTFVAVKNMTDIKFYDILAPEMPVQSVKRSESPGLNFIRDENGALYMIESVSDSKLGVYSLFNRTRP